MSARNTVLTCCMVAEVTAPEAAAAAASVGSRTLEKVDSSWMVLAPRPIRESRLPAVSSVTDSAPTMGRNSVTFPPSTPW